MELAIMQNKQTLKQRLCDIHLEIIMWYNSYQMNYLK